MENPKEKIEIKILMLVPKQVSFPVKTLNNYAEV